MTYSTGFAKRIDNYPALVSGLLLTLGSLFFIIGGSHHPRINSTLGPLGSEQFYQAFAAHAAHTAAGKLSIR